MIESSLINSESLISSAKLFLDLICVPKPSPRLVVLMSKYIAESDKNKEHFLGEIKRGFTLQKMNTVSEATFKYLKVQLAKSRPTGYKRRIFLVSGRAASGKSFVCQKLQMLMKNLELIDGDGYLLPSRKERAQFEDKPLEKFQLTLFESHLKKLSFSTNSIPALHYREWDGRVITDGYVGKNPNTDIIIDSVFYGTLKDYERLSSLSSATIFVATEDSIALVNRIRRDLRTRNAFCDSVRTKIQNDYDRLLKQHIPLNWIYLKKSKFVLLTHVRLSHSKIHPFQYSYSIYQKK